MASKNLTHIFMIMRDKAIQRQNMYRREEGYSDEEALVSGEDIENRIGASGLPDWTSFVEEVQYNISTLKEKTKRLAFLHNNLIRCPSLDDNSEEENQLAILTNEIKQLLERCQMSMLQIQKVRCRGREKTLKNSVVQSLAFSLQEVKQEFIQTCSSYVKSKSDMKKTSSFLLDTGGTDYDSDYGTFEDGETNQSKMWSQEQMLFLEDNTLQVQERDRAVQKVVKSTVELNELFRGIAQLVHDQGTILDRIDFNVEHASVQVQSGTQQLRKADQHHRKSRHMICILGLAAAIIFMLILIVLTKT